MLQAIALTNRSVSPGLLQKLLKEIVSVYNRFFGDKMFEDLSMVLLMKLARFIPNSEWFEPTTIRTKELTSHWIQSY